MNTFLVATCAWLATLSAPADELRRDRVPADVDLVVHLDLEGFKQTQIWKHMLTAMDEADLDSDLGDLNELKSRFGIDPLTDVRAITLFKVESEEEPTVVLFSATPVVDEALRKFQKEPGYERITVSGIERHTWREDSDDDKAYAYVHNGPNDERVIVLAANQNSAVHAARVLRGEDPSHQKAGTLLSLSPARGSFLYFAAKHIPHIED